MERCVLAYFKKTAEGEVVADGQKIIRQTLDNNLMSKSGIASHFGIQASQVTKIAGNLRARDVRKFCEHVIELHRELA